MIIYVHFLQRQSYPKYSKLTIRSTKKCEKFQIRGDDLLKFGTLTVSSEHHNHFEFKMFDNDPTTIWHSQESRGGWIRYVFNNQQVVSNVAIIRRGNEDFLV